MSRETKIKRLSKTLRIATLATLCLLPLFQAGYWITGGFPLLAKLGFDFTQRFSHIANVSIPPIGQLSDSIKFLGFLVDMIPTAITMASLAFLAKLFRLYENLQIFSEKSVHCIRNAGYALLINQLVHPLYMGLMTLTLTFYNPPGQRTLTIALGSEELKFIGFALFIILISYIMEIGTSLQEEQNNTI
ncbi:MAG: DUF2975 domain-containing protein [Verrucomicrobia bacterium]|nr:DUF2975 domain-containing protein [Verrucomicrobiota bacterium]